MNPVWIKYRFTLLLLFVGALVPANETFAQDAGCGKERNVAAHALDEISWKQLNRVYEDVGEGRYDEAYATLQKMTAQAHRDNYLQAILDQALAQVEWSRENYDAALAYFEKAVARDVLPDRTHFALMYQIAQLYYLAERHQEALEKLALWFCQAPPETITATAFVLQASIHAQKEDFAEALESIEVAISMDDDPKEQWYQLSLAAHYELEHYSEAAETLEAIINRWPDKKMYWIQLSQIYLELGQDEKALAVLALAYRRKLLDTQSDVTFLANLYSNANVPYKAAEVLEKGINDGVAGPTQKNWTLVADSWYAAEELEKSLLAYQMAGEASVDGNIDLRRAYILIDLERWQDTLSALNDALKKGGLDERRIGEAYLLRGMAQFNLDNFEVAHSDWVDASQYANARESAQQWINHLREERRQRQRAGN